MLRKVQTVNCQPAAQACFVGDWRLLSFEVEYGGIGCSSLCCFILCSYLPTLVPIAKSPRVHLTFYANMSGPKP